MIPNPRRRPKKTSQSFFPFFAASAYLKYSIYSSQTDKKRNLRKNCLTGFSSPSVITQKRVVCFFLPCAHSIAHSSLSPSLRFVIRPNSYAIPRKTGRKEEEERTFIRARTRRGTFPKAHTSPLPRESESSSPAEKMGNFSSAPILTLRDSESTIRRPEGNVTRVNERRNER